MPSVCSFSAEQLAEARRQYDAGASLAAIAKFLGVSGPTVRRYLNQWGWPSRSGGKTKQQQIAPVCGGEASPEAPPADTQTLMRRVEASVRQELAGIEVRLGSQADPAEAERNARVLASLVKSLTELAKLDVLNKQNTGGAGSKARGSEYHGSFADEYDTDLPPRDLAALRQELAARLERLQAERTVE
ncbi:MAG: hypothetical protein NWT00_00350 [Beijerinckiaceae bacterium]|jgi:hypothetical protein|nr:hypothetical protein [Beijerinckiaceae bacterium]